MFHSFSWYHHNISKQFIYISCSVSDPPILPSLLYQPPLRRNSTHACGGSAHRDEDCPPNIDATGGPRREDLYHDIWSFSDRLAFCCILTSFLILHLTTYSLLKQISRLKHLTSYSLIPQSSAFPIVKGILAAIHFNFCFLTFFLIGTWVATSHRDFLPGACWEWMAGDIARRFILGRQ